MNSAFLTAPALSIGLVDVRSLIASVNPVMKISFLVESSAFVV